MKKNIVYATLITTAFILNAVPCYASTSSVSVSTSSSKSDYTSLPDAETLKKDVGFVPKLKSTLANDFKFDTGAIRETYEEDSNGTKMNARKGINFKYAYSKSGTTKTVSLFAEEDGYQTYSKDSSIIKYGDYSLYFNDTQANSLAWADNGVSYILMDVNKKVTKDELVSMAKEMIDLQ